MESSDFHKNLAEPLFAPSVTPLLLLQRLLSLELLGGIGQPLSMLCKHSNEIDELSCYDIVGTPGVAADLSHVSTYSTLLRGP